LLRNPSLQRRILPPDRLKDPGNRVNRVAPN
jgi:hypothetical protein